MCIKLATYCIFVELGPSMKAVYKRIKEKVCRYVMERHCRMGGFCFYRIEEPNGLDTYCALSILKLLDIPFHDDRTVAYLRDMQHEDGVYDSAFAAFYSLKSLAILGKSPLSNPLPYIRDHVDKDRVTAEKLPVEIHSVFHRMTCLVDLFTMIKKCRDEGLEKRIIQYILTFHNRDSGFGYPKSTLAETAKALTMLAKLNYPLKPLQAENFLRRCEIANYGFTNIPGASLSFLEFIHSGIIASAVLNYQPRYAKDCMVFIMNCQNKTGGFARTTQNGIATLENSFYAVKALKLMSAFN